MPTAWNPPVVGDILWCHFPQLPDTHAGPKPRPALVVRVTERVDGVVVSLVYGTSQKLTRLYAGEFAIRESENPAAFKLAGLSFDTKFSFKHIVELPWGNEFFSVAPRVLYGQNPKLGTLHPSMMRAAKVAYEAA